MFNSITLDKIYQSLLIILAFLIPLTVFGANLIIVIICIIWLFSGSYKTKFLQIINSKFLISSIIFFIFHIIGLLWTDDLIWGFHMVHKMWYFFLLLPILFTLTKKENIKLYISAFLFAIAVTEVASYLVWLEFVEPFKNATINNPTPFMSHISYNPILAFAIYLVLHELFFNKKIANFLFAFYSFFAISMTINMFITGGRAGQVCFFLVIAVLIFQVLDKQRIRAFITILIIFPSIIITAYEFSDLFRYRADLAISEVINISNTSNNSVGLRINFSKNSFDVFKENILFGVGTGDFPDEYRKINQINTPELMTTTNPHNMYTLILMQLGLFGLFSMISIFYYQFKYAFNAQKKFIRNAGCTLPLMFLVMMLSDSYLLGHYTTLMYVFFSSFLYKDFEYN
jgi:O-antigen ligase